MRVETRKSILPILIAALFVLPGNVDSDQTPLPDPDVVITQRCTFCHSRILTVVLLSRHADLYGLDRTEIFLTRHNLSNAAARAAILRYLEQAADLGGASP